MANLVRPLLLLPLLLPLGGAAIGRNGPAQDPELVAAQKASMQATLLSLGEQDQRLTVPVAVSGRGPYNFIIDTGAERTVVSRELAGMLDLSAGQPLTLTSMTEKSQVDTVVVPNLTIKSIGGAHTVVAPSLDARHLGAAGLLGIDTLRNHQVTINFDAGTMTVQPSAPRRRTARSTEDEIIVSAKSVFGQLIVTDAYYRSTRVQVVLDTGSQVTLGNEALRKRVGSNGSKAQLIKMTSVTGGTIFANYKKVPDFKIGNVEFTGMPIAFAEVAPFARFGLTKRPAILMGMDSLRNFRQVEIDFPNRQVRFLMPRAKLEPIDRRFWQEPLPTALGHAQ